MLNELYHNEDTVVVACRMLESEYNRACEQLGIAYRTYWLDEMLHNTPENLHTQLQKVLDGLPNCKRAILVYGACGNATDKLVAGDYTLILPKVQDCISLLLGSDELRQKVQDNCPTYFVTEKWVNGTNSIVAEFERTVDKYGEKRATRIFSVMLGNYRRFGLLDTMCYSLSEVNEKIERVARLLDLKREVIPCTTDFLRDLLIGPWDDERFWVIPPYGQLRCSSVQKH